MSDPTITCSIPILLTTKGMEGSVQSSIIVEPDILPLANTLLDNGYLFTKVHTGQENVYSISHKLFSYSPMLQGTTNKLGNDFCMGALIQTAHDILFPPSPNPGYTQEQLLAEARETIRLQRKQIDSLAEHRNKLQNQLAATRSIDALSRENHTLRSRLEETKAHTGGIDVEKAAKSMRSMVEKLSQPAHTLDDTKTHLEDFMQSDFMQTVQACEMLNAINPVITEATLRIKALESDLSQFPKYVDTGRHFPPGSAAVIYFFILEKPLPGVMVRVRSCKACKALMFYPAGDRYGLSGNYLDKLKLHGPYPGTSGFYSNQGPCRIAANAWAAEQEGKS